MSELRSLVYPLLSSSDLDAIALAACSLDTHPGKKNWVEKEGGLPQYICEIARAILRGGTKDVSSAIAIAVSRVKKWAAGVGVNAKAQAKAAAALAEWEKMKASANAKSAAKDVSKSVKATYADDEFELKLTSLFSVTDYSVSDADLALAATFEDCSGEATKTPLETLVLSRGQKNFVSLAVLTTKVRKALSASDFAIPSKRAYPIQDEAHARNALARVMQFGTPAEQAQVFAAVHRRYPKMDIEKYRKKEPVAATGEQNNLVALAVLTTKARKKLSTSAFAIPDKRAYPIHDEAHARAALARVEQFGTPDEKAQVRAAVKRRYPNMEIAGKKKNKKD